MKKYTAKSEKKSVSLPADLWEALKTDAEKSLNGNVSGVLYEAAGAYLTGSTNTPQPLKSLFESHRPGTAGHFGALLEEKRIDQSALLDSVLQAVYYFVQRYNPGDTMENLTLIAESERLAQLIGFMTTGLKNDAAPGVIQSLETVLKTGDFDPKTLAQLLKK